MRYQDRQLLERLAGEYALGTLTGSARKRFERVMRDNPEAERLMIEWQERLAPLAETTPAVTPPPRVWKRIQQRISKPHTRLPIHWWERLALWRPLALANGLLVLVLAGYLGIRILSPSDPVSSELLYVGVLESAQKTPTVVVLAYSKPWRLEVQSKAPFDLQEKHELRIWIATDADTKTAPSYLASLAAGASEVRLSETSWKQLQQARYLLVNQEPLGSANLRPMGEILYSGPCINLKKWSANTAGEQQQ